MIKKSFFNPFSSLLLALAGLACLRRTMRPFGNVSTLAGFKSIPTSSCLAM